MTKCLSPWSTLSLYLSYLTATSTLLQEHRCLLRRPEGKAREHHKKKRVIYLFYLLVYLFSLSAPCHLGVGHGAGGPRGEEQDVWAWMLEWVLQSRGCLVSDLTEFNVSKNKASKARKYVFICLILNKYKFHSYQTDYHDIMQFMHDLFIYFFLHIFPLSTEKFWQEWRSSRWCIHLNLMYNDRWPPVLGSTASLGSVLCFTYWDCEGNWPKLLQCALSSC